MKLDSDVANKEKKLLTVQSEDVESQDMELELGFGMCPGFIGFNPR